MTVTTAYNEQYMPLVLVGPHGAGKSALFELIVKKYPFEFAFHQTCTTREIDEEDSSDDDTIIISKAKFEEMID